MELTRRGKRVAAIISAEEYDRLVLVKSDFWTGLVKFRERLAAENIEFMVQKFEATSERTILEKVRSLSLWLNAMTTFFLDTSFMITWS